MTKVVEDKFFEDKLNIAPFTQLNIDLCFKNDKPESLSMC
jgi:hypothetical protein